MSIRALLFASASNYLSTLNKVDFFNDGSGKALYMLEDNALDESGNYNGIATSVTYGNGRFGRSVNATSVSSRILTNLVTPNEFTISIWANIPAYPINKVIYDFSNGGKRAMLATSSVGGLSFYTDSYKFTDIPPINQWNHIVVSYAAGELKYYLNGATPQVISITLPNDSLQSAVLGHFANGYALVGSYDQIRVFNKALTQAEVTALYNEI